MQRTATVFVLSLASLLAPVAANGNEPSPQTGTWRAWLDSPGGELAFQLTMTQRDGGWRARLDNGDEHIDLPAVQLAGATIEFSIEHYDSIISARLSDNGARMDGEWKKRARDGGWTTMGFHATAGSSVRFRPASVADDTKEGVTASTATTPATAVDVSGRWLTTFSKSDEPAIGVFDQSPDGTVTGTFMTSTGDYRYLAGRVDGRRLRLSAFDGAHAFLFDAKLGSDGTLRGDFWSRDAWHETWTAKRSDDARLTDGFSLTQWNQGVSIADITVHDLVGNPRSLESVFHGGSCRIIEVFGTWCPNCHDAADLLREFDRMYRDKGLSIVGVAFEYTGEIQRSVRQLKRFAKRHAIEFPLVIGGIADRTKAKTMFPLIDSLRAYPTTIIMDGDGHVVAIHTGFAGPATGEEYTKLRSELDRLIRKLLDLPDTMP